MDENLDQFFEQLLDEKGYKTLTGDVREEVKQGMADRLMDQINEAIILSLPEDKAIELDKKLDDEGFGEKEMLDFVADCGIDTTEIILKTMAQFRSFYLAEPQATDDNMVAEEA